MYRGFVFIPTNGYRARGSGMHGHIQKKLRHLRKALAKTPTQHSFLAKRLQPTHLPAMCWLQHICDSKQFGSRNYLTDTDTVTIPLPIPTPITSRYRKYHGTATIATILSETTLRFFRVGSSKSISLPSAAQGKTMSHYY